MSSQPVARPAAVWIGLGTHGSAQTSWAAILPDYTETALPPKPTERSLGRAGILHSR